MYSMPRIRIPLFLALGLSLSLMACVQNAPLTPPPGVAAKSIALSNDQFVLDGRIWEENGEHFIQGTLKLTQVAPGQYRGAKLIAELSKDGKKTGSVAMRVSYNRNADLCEFQGVIGADEDFDHISFNVSYSYRLD